jgi:hypothetical protein
VRDAASLTRWSLEPIHDGGDQVGNKSIDVYLGDDMGGDRGDDIDSESPPTNTTITFVRESVKVLCLVSIIRIALFS